MTWCSEITRWWVVVGRHFFLANIYRLSDLHLTKREHCSREPVHWRLICKVHSNSLLKPEIYDRNAHTILKHTRKWFMLRGTRCVLCILCMCLQIFPFEINSNINGSWIYQRRNFRYTTAYLARIAIVDYAAFMPAPVNSSVGMVVGTE